MACRFSELVVDCGDPEGLAGFWGAPGPPRPPRGRHLKASARSRRVGPEGVRAAVTKRLNGTGERPLAAVSAGGRQCHRVEGFRDAGAGASHVGTEAFRNFVDIAPDLVAAQPQIIYVDAPDVAGWGPMGEISPR